MTYVQKPNTATIWENQKNKENQPDFRGTINVGGKELEIALWKKTSSGGKRFLGGTVQEPRQRQERHIPDPDPANGHGVDGGFDDDIPF